MNEQDNVFHAVDINAFALRQARGQADAGAADDGDIVLVPWGQQSRPGYRPFRCYAGGEPCSCPCCAGQGRSCSTCGSTGSVQVGAPALECRYCRGSGRQPAGADVPCPVCAGKGRNQVSFPLEICPACGGRGRRVGEHLPCVACRGRGVRRAVVSGPRPLTAGERSVLDIISRAGSGGRSRVARRLGTSTTYAGAQIQSLVEKGWLGAAGGGVYVPSSGQSRRHRIFSGPQDFPPAEPERPEERPEKRSKARAPGSGPAGEPGMGGWLSGMAPRPEPGQTRGARANTATVRKRAKKAIAVAWASARGKQRRRPSDLALEREAARWQEAQDNKLRETQEAEGRRKRFAEAVRHALGQDGASGTAPPAELLAPIAWIHGEAAREAGGSCLFVEPRGRRRHRKPGSPQVVYRLELDERRRVIALTISSAGEMARAKESEGARGAKLAKRAKGGR